MIEFKQMLSEEDYRKGAYNNYFKRPITRVLNIFSLMLVILSIFLFLTKDFYFILFGVFFVLYGAYVFFRKYIYINNTIKSVKSNKNFGLEIYVSINESGMMESRQGSDLLKTDLKTFYGYHLDKIGIFLYPQRNLFFIIKKESMENDKYDSLIKLIEGLSLKKI